MKLFKNRLKENLTGNRLTISWFNITFFDFIAIFLISCVGLYLLAEYLEWKELRGLKIITPNFLARIIMWSILILLTLYLLFNRKSVLIIEAGKIHFRKRQITGISRSFSKKKITNIECKLQKTHYENEAGNYPDIYDVYIMRKNHKKIRLGSFNEEDAARLKTCLKK